MTTASPPILMISPNYTGLVYITGADAFTFLQNIITQDLTLLDTQDIIHSAFLTPQGKYLHDFYIRKITNGYVFACEGDARCEDLATQLTKYKLRANVTIEPKFLQGSGWVNPEDTEYKTWDKERIAKSIPDGSRDAEIGVSTLAELNLATEQTVSFTKGCYVGQEIVARMHHRNLGKKHLVGVDFFDTPPAYGSEIEGFGTMRSSCEHHGLILMNREAEESLKQGQIKNAPFRLLGL